MKSLRSHCVCVTWGGQSLHPSPRPAGPMRGSALGVQDAEAAWWPGCLQLLPWPPLCLHSKDESAFMVDPLTAQGVAVVIVAYDIAPEGNGWSCRFGSCRSGGLWRGVSP